MLYKWFVAAQLAIREGRNGEARTILEETARLFPDAAMVHATLAHLELEAGDVASARAHAERAVAIETDLLEAHRVLAEIFLSAPPAPENLERAEGHLAAVVRLAPYDGKARMRLGIVRMRLQDYDGAADAFAGFAPGASGYGRAQLEIGRIRLFQGDTAAALTAWEEASARGEPEVRVEALRRLVRTTLGSGEDDLARRYLQELRELLPASLDLDRLQVLLDIRTGRFDELLPLLESISERTGEPVEWSVVGEIARAGGETEAASEAYERALAQNPRETAALWGLAVLAAAEEDTIAAVAYFERFLRLHPDEPTALNYVAYTWAVENRNLDRAEAYVRHALDLAPGTPYYLDTLGWVLYRKGRFEEAREAIEEAIVKMPEDPTILDHLGDVLWALEENEAALAAWRKALANGGGENADELPEKIAEAERRVR